MLVLAIAVNLEPTRIGLLPLLLSRRNPLLQLLAYLIGAMTVSIGFGLAVLFVFDQKYLGSGASNGGKAQIAVGLLALAVAAVMTVRGLTKRRRARVPEPVSAETRPEPVQTPEPAHAPDPGQTESTSAIDKFTIAVRRILGKGGSPLFAGLVGVGTGLPSVDYLAVLLVIATSGKSPTVQVAALLTCILVSSLVILAPLVSFLIAPAATLARIDRFSAWTRSRSTLEYAGLLALIGCLLIGLGISHQ